MNSGHWANRRDRPETSNGRVLHRTVLPEKQQPALFRSSAQLGLKLTQKGRRGGSCDYHLVIQPLLPSEGIQFCPNCWWPGGGVLRERLEEIKGRGLHLRSHGEASVGVGGRLPGGYFGVTHAVSSPSPLPCK